MLKLHSYKQRFGIGAVYALASALSFAAMAFCVHCAREGIPSQELVFFRSLINFVILTPLVFRSLNLLATRAAWVVFLRGVAGTGSVLCYFWTLQNETASNATALTHLTPLFVTVASWILLKERLSAIELAAICVLVLGAYSLHHTDSVISPYVFLVGTCGAICAASAYISLRKAALHFSPNLIVWVFSLIGIIVAHFVPGKTWIVPQVADYPFILAVGLLGLFGQICMTHSYIYLKAPIACALGLTSLLWQITMEAAFHNHIALGSTWISYLLLMIGVFILQTRTKSSATKTDCSIPSGTERRSA